MYRPGGTVTTILLWTLLVACLAVLLCYGCTPSIGHQRPKAVGGNEPLAWKNAAGKRVKCSPGQICSESDQQPSGEENNEEQKDEEDPCDIEETFFGEKAKQSTKGGHKKSQKNKAAKEKLDRSGFKLDEDCIPGKTRTGPRRTASKTQGGKTCVTYDVEAGEVARVGMVLCGTGFINFQISILDNLSLLGTEIARVKVKCPPALSPETLITFICTRVNDTDPKDVEQAWRVMRNLQYFMDGAQFYSPSDGYFFTTNLMSCLEVERCRDNLYDCSSQAIRRKGKAWWQALQPLVMENEETPTIEVDNNASSENAEIPDNLFVDEVKKSHGDEKKSENEEALESGGHTTNTFSYSDQPAETGKMPTKQNETPGKNNLSQKDFLNEKSEEETQITNDKNVDVQDNLSDVTSDDTQYVEKDTAPESFAHEVARNVFVASADKNQCTKDDGMQKQPKCVNNQSSTTECTVDVGVNNSGVATSGRNSTKDNRGIDDAETTKLPAEDGECPRGYYLSNGSCIDVDECHTDEHRCEHLCLNTPGGYKCLCPRGFKVAMDGISCEDLDECDHSSSSVDCHSCENTLGSYRCLCNPGYTPNKNKKSCDDVNECLLHTSGCSQGCVNTIGSYNCNCEQGYFLLDDMKTCEDLDECRLNISGCAHECKNTQGSFQCNCREGYYLAEDAKSCLDIDECLRNTSGCAHLCENTMGSFICKCKRGYFLMEDKKQCDDRDECAVDENGEMYARCSHKCTNLPNGFMCNCPEGYSVSETAPSICVELPQAVLSTEAKTKAGGLA